MTAAREDPRPVRSRAALLDATMRLLESGGVAAVTVDAVTAESGVARATLYRNYATTAELIAAAFERMLPQLDVDLPGRSLRGDLLRLVSAQAQLIDTVPLHAVMLGWTALASPGDDADSAHRRALREGLVERYRQPLARLLAGDRAAAELRPRTRTPAGLETAIAQLAGPLVFNRLVVAVPNDRTVCTRIVEDFLRAHSR